jgi:hypothetical protein
MPYIPTEWKNREVERPRTYTKIENPDGTITLIPSEGNIIEPGTPIIADNMNKIEQGIVDAHGVVDVLNEHLEENATEAAKGHIQLANSAEATTGTDNTKAMTPATTKTVVDAMGAVKSPLRYPIKNIGANKTLALADVNSRFLLFSSSDIVITVPLDTFAIGDEMEFINWGGGGVFTFAPSSGVVIRSKDGKLSIDGQYGVVVLTQVKANEWLLIGSLA